MKHRPWVLETLVLVTACAPTRDAGGRLDFQPERFASESGDSVAGEITFLNVPRNYADPSLGTLRLAVARLRSAGSVPGSPILYLSGGPGAWGIHPERMPLLDALRAHGDVYTFDQRGTGRSTPVLSCSTQSELPAGSAPGQGELRAMYREQAEACVAHWQAQGVDLSDFNTVMSARDVDAIREALGVAQLRLVATSYGAHLAFAYMRLFGPHVERAVLALVEGPDHTLKLPSNTDKHLAFVSDLLARDPVIGNLLPDFHHLVEQTIATLDRQPLELDVVVDDTTVTYTLTAFDFKRVVAGMIGRRFSIQFIPEDFVPLMRGELHTMAGALPGLRSTEESAMRWAMDCASGVSEARREQVVNELETSLLGMAADFPYPHVCDAWGVTDLGEAFRAPLISATPVLFVSGTLDGRTPVSNAEEVMTGFENSSHLIVEDVGHEGFVFFASPELLTLVGEFLNGRQPESQRLLGRPLEFSLPR